MITTGWLGQGSPRTLGGWDRSRRGIRRRSTFPPASRLVSGNPVPKFDEGPDWLRRKSGEPLGKPSQLQGPLIHAGLGGLPPAGLRRGPEVSGRWEASDRGWVAQDVQASLASPVWCTPREPVAGESTWPSSAPVLLLAATQSIFAVRISAPPQGVYAGWHESGGMAGQVRG